MSAVLLLTACESHQPTIGNGQTPLDHLCGAAIQSGPSNVIVVTPRTPITPEIVRKWTGVPMWLEVSDCEHGVDLRFSPQTIMTVVRTIPAHDGHPAFAVVRPGPPGSKGELDLIQDGKVKVKVKIEV